MHRGQRGLYPVRRLRLLDLFAQLLELVHLGVVVGLEVGVGQHLLDIVVELFVLHELVVEVERHGEPVRDGPRREPQRPQHGYVGRLDTKGVPVVEADLAEWGDRGHREVSLRRLGFCGPGGGVVCVHLRLGGCSDRISGVGHCVMNVAADEVADGLVVQSLANEGVGQAVLQRSQVDVGKGCLWHGADDAGDAGQFVGQRPVDHHVTGAGTLIRVQASQQTVPLPGV